MSKTVLTDQDIDRAMRSPFATATKMHELLRLAIDDFEAISQDSRYKIKMNDWHEPRNGDCSVCLAGCVMANQLGAQPHERFGPYSYPEKLSRYLHTVDLLRQWRVRAAYEEFYGKPPDIVIDSVYLPSYSAAPGLWREAMASLHNDLKERNI